MTNRALNIDLVRSCGPLIQRFREYLPLAIAVFIGFCFRYAAAWHIQSLGVELTPDPKGFMLLAEELLRFSYACPSRMTEGLIYNICQREPMFPLTLAFSFLLLGQSVWSVRLTTVILSTLTIFASYKLGVLAHSKSAGLLLAIMLAFDPFLIMHSLRGFNQDLYTLLIIIFCYQVISSAASRFKGGALDSVVLIMVILTRIEGTIFALGACIFALWYSKINGLKTPKQYILEILTVAFAANMVWAVLSWVANGDAAMTQFSRDAGSWWYWYEFGVPKNVTTLDYLFRYHHLSQLIFMWITGSQRMILNQLSPTCTCSFTCVCSLYVFLGAAGLILAAVGFIYSCRLHRTVFVHIAVISFFVVYAVFFGISSQVAPTHLGADYRYDLPMLPFIYYFISVLIVAAKRFSERWDKALVSEGFIFSFPITRKRHIRVLPSHLCYLLLAIVVIHQMTIASSYLRIYPFSYLVGQLPNSWG